MTDRLYYDDCYRAEFDAVAEVASDGRVYLDRTAFYPTSGGQPHDLGTIGGVPVLDVIDHGERIVHVLADAITPGHAACRVDWKRRYDHMQQHTAQHLLSAVFAEAFGYPTLSFHLGPEVSTIELGVRQLADAELERAEASANEIAQQARPVTISYDDAETAEGLRKPSARAGKLRIITIDGLDRSGCGGTHVKSTSEVAPIQLRGMEKVRGHVRLEYVAGERARRRARADYTVAAAMARSEGVPIDKLPEHAAGLRERLTQLEKRNRTLAAELAEMQGVAMYAAAPVSSDGLKRLRLPVTAVDEEIRARLQAFAAHGGAIALAHTAPPGSILVACSADSGAHAGNVLKNALRGSGGSGGGSATMAQGKLSNQEALSFIAAQLGFAESTDPT